MSSAGWYDLSSPGFTKAALHFLALDVDADILWEEDMHFDSPIESMDLFVGRKIALTHCEYPMKCTAMEFVLKLLSGDRRTLPISHVVEERNGRAEFFCLAETVIETICGDQSTLVHIGLRSFPLLIDLGPCQTDAGCLGWQSNLIDLVPYCVAARDVTLAVLFASCLSIFPALGSRSVTEICLRKILREESSPENLRHNFCHVK
jgi:hypothetical protein